MAVYNTFHFCGWKRCFCPISAEVKEVNKNSALFSLNVLCFFNNLYWTDLRLALAVLAAWQQQEETISWSLNPSKRIALYMSGWSRVEEKALWFDLWSAKQVASTVAYQTLYMQCKACWIAGCHKQGLQSLVWTSFGSGQGWSVSWWILQKSLLLCVSAQAAQRRSLCVLQVQQTSVAPTHPLRDHCLGCLSINAAFL